VREDIIFAGDAASQAIASDSPKMWMLPVCTWKCVGEGVVTAADIHYFTRGPNHQPGTCTFSLPDNSKTRLDIELIVERGRGYAPSNERGRMPIGELPVDAIFSPIKRVNLGSPGGPG